ncbi:hypothetical protein [Mycobacteroides salmoniphilum]|uniref:hypothetical protein n=1 Tax=Mycobacteroides salmoniphilum TaxID=404941 RepID=UPI0010665F8A|nr:hypothetical protein [Mycobacteroides salmoniphilum]TDZ80914.1 hypothetical protein DE4586_00857 [Mycobacteroides salmoniphilum]TDZ88414.1 hypothetical protein DE4587_00773 [Mycobacteroides salmoniphilum]
MSTISVAIAVVSVGLFVLSIALAWQAQRMRKQQQHNKAGIIRSQGTSHNHLNQQEDRTEKLGAITLQEDETLSAVHKEAQNL